MRIKRGAAAAAVVSLLVLPGCAAALMAAGPVSLPLTLMAAGPMEELGLFDGLDDLTAPDMNPALLRHPALADAQLSADQSRLIEALTVFEADVSGGLATAGALDCALDEDSRWLLALQTSAASYNEQISVMPPAERPRIDAVEAALLEGSCEDGKIEGPFTAVTRFATVHNAAGMTIYMTDRRRVTGTAQEGRLEGELMRAGVMESHTTSIGQVTRHVSQGLYRYSDGEPVGKSLVISSITDASGQRTQISTIVTEHVAQNRQKMTVYMGDMLFTESTLQDGRLEGWMVNHPAEIVKGYKSDGARTCYRAGQVAPDAACAGLSS